MTDKRKKALALGMVLVAIIVVLIAGVIYRSKSPRERKQQISLIVYGNDVNRWENLRQGAEQVCADNQAELTLVNMSGERDATEQIALIEREVASGADALLIAACDSDAIGAYVDTHKIPIPVVFVETGVNSRKKTTAVTADDYEMGRALGREIVERENPIVKVAIISESTQRENVCQREQGLREVVEPFANQVVTWERYDNEKNMITRKFIQRALLEEAVDVVVALDNDTADALMDALVNLNRKTKVYAISTSDQSVYYLDQGKIKSLEYQTEFSIGYIGAQYVVHGADKPRKFKSEDIMYRVVKKENMYEKDNQALLFPFVQ